MPALAENVPLGVKDWAPPRRDPECERCGALLATQRHAPWCAEGAPLVRFMDLTGNPVVRRAEEALARCTAKAYRAWLLSAGGAAR